MCHNHTKYFLSFLLLFVFGTDIFAQTSTVSNPTSDRKNDPYSRYGVGTLSNGNNTVLKGMADITSAYASPYTVNTDNPASYAFLKLTTYEAGAEVNMATLHTDGQNYSTGMASLSYLNIGIPISKNAGICLGLRPYSHVYYQLNDTANVPGVGNSANVYSGDGSVNYAFVGAAAKYKGFSIGVNFGYMFGNILNSSLLEPYESDTNTLNSDFSRYTRIGGLYWKGGVMYQTRLNKKLSISIGGTVTMSQNLNTWKDEYWSSYQIMEDVTAEDSAYQTTSTKGKLIMPMSYSFGVQLMGNDQWMVGVDYSAVNWSQYRNDGQTDSLAANTYKISVGGQYTPDATDIRNYFRRVTYRLGFYYGSDYVKLRNTDMNFYAFTVGGSLPFRRATDQIHIGLEFGKRGTEVNSLILENYFRFSLGISLNDKWFVKRKYD